MNITIPEEQLRGMIAELERNYKEKLIRQEYLKDKFPDVYRALEKACVARKVPYQKIVDLYHEVLPELPQCKMLTTKRKGQIKQRHLHDMKDLDTWREYFGYVRESSFLMGNVPAYGDRRPFIANLEWLTNESNFCKVYEEKYHG